MSNKIGSLSAALCAKWHNLGTKNEPGVRVAVLSDSDKIAAPDHEQAPPEEHPASELSGAWDVGAWARMEGKAEVRVNGEWFEWVNATLVDFYIMEIGVLGIKDVERISGEVRELEKYIFRSSEG